MSKHSHLPKDDGKGDIQLIERAIHEDDDLDKANLNPRQLKSSQDKLTSWQTAIRFRKAVIMCTLMCVAAGADGYQINLNGSVIANLGFVRQVGYQQANGTYALNANYTATWGALQSLGQMIAMVFLNPISDRVGRKYTLYCLWCILCASILIETFVQNWTQWAGAKLLAGVGVGAIQMTLPVYITEWAPVNIRGSMIIAYGIWNNIGNFLAPVVLLIAEKRDAYDYRTPILTQFAFLGLMLPIFIYLPETPSFFAARGQHEKGIACLRRINGNVPGYDVEAEYAIFVNIVEEERMLKSEDIDTRTLGGLIRSYAACFKGVDRRRTFAAALPAVLQQLNGLAFLNIYAAFFFRQSGFANAFEITSILTAIKIVGNLAIVFVTDRFGRRTIVLTAGWWCCIMLLVVGAAGQNPNTTPIRSLVIAAACMWSFGSTMLGSLGWTFIGEVPAQRMRARTAGLAAAISVIFGLTFNTSVPIMLDATRANLGYNTAFIFVGLGGIANVAAVFLVPEPSRRNAAELDELYEKRIPAWRMSKYVTDVQKNAAQAGESTKS